jgi:hypothetical protein
MICSERTKEEAANSLSAGGDAFSRASLGIDTIYNLTTTARQQHETLLQHAYCMYLVERGCQTKPKALTPM